MKHLMIRLVLNFTLGERRPTLVGNKLLLNFAPHERPTQGNKFVFKFYAARAAPFLWGTSLFLNFTPHERRQRRGEPRRPAGLIRREIFLLLRHASLRNKLVILSSLMVTTSLIKINVFKFYAPRGAPHLYWTPRPAGLIRKGNFFIITSSRQFSTGTKVRYQSIGTFGYF